MNLKKIYKKIKSHFSQYNIVVADAQVLFKKDYNEELSSELLLEYSKSDSHKFELDRENVLLVDLETMEAVKLNKDLDVFVLDDRKTIKDLVEEIDYSLKSTNTIIILVPEKTVDLREERDVL